MDYSFNKKSIVTINLFLSILLIILCLMRNIYNFDIIVLFISVFMFISMFNYKPYLFLKYLFSIFYFLFMIIGLYLCNNTNLYLYEIDKFSHYNGSFPVAILYYLVFFVSLIFFDGIFEKKFKYYQSKTGSEKNYNFLGYIFFFIAMIILLTVFKNPSFSLKVDRFVYKESFLPGWVGKLQSILLCMTPMILYPFIKNNKKIGKKELIIILIILSPFLLYGLWTGNKFGLFLDIMILIMSPLIVYIEKKKLKVEKYDNLSIKKIKKTNDGFSIKKTLIATTMFLVLLLVPYYYFRGLDISQSLLNRSAQQGQLWWSTYEMSKTNHINELDDEIIPIKNAVKGYASPDCYGIYKIMQLTTPHNIYIAKLSSGSRYSAQGIEIAYYYFSYIGILIHAILRALVEAYLVNLLIKSVFSYRYIETYISAKLILTVHFIFTQGDLYRLFTKSSIICIIILLFLELLQRKKEQYA